MAEYMEDENNVAAMVKLYIYDLTNGIASLMPDMLLGRHLDGIWHTAVVVHRREYFFGPLGIQSAIPGSTRLKEPLKIEEIGFTFLPYSVFLDYINGLGSTKFAPGTYNLFKHNCNNFSDEVSHFLVGTGIPKYILDLPEEILQTSLGQTLIPLIEDLTKSAAVVFTNGRRFVNTIINREDSPELQALNSQIEQARLTSIALEEKRNVINEKLAKKERKKKKKDKKKKDKNSRESGSESNSTGSTNWLEMAEQDSTLVEPPSHANGDGAEVLPSERILQMEAEEKRELEEIKRQRDPPIIFRDIKDAKAEFESLRILLQSKLNDSEMLSIDELHQYILENEGSWALGDNFLNFVGRVFYDKSLDSAARVCLLNILAIAALKDDVILLLHQDRKDHTIMNFAYGIDRHPVEEQLPLAQFIANLFDNLSSSEWLMYISEWQHQNQGISNIRVTTKVAVHSLLSDCEDLQIRGSAIIHNLACKEVFDDVAVELTIALLQYFKSGLAEEQLYSCMKSLARFTQISGQEVPQLIQMIGPEPAKFRGCSQRIDELIDEINKKLRV